MKKIYLLTLSVLLAIPFIAQDKSEIKPYTDFLEQQNISAKDYVFELFNRYNIVILCERDHRDITQYELLLDIFRDKRFTEDIRNAYFEIGNCVYNDTLNSFLKNTNLTPGQVKESILSFQRNSYGAALWEKANYSYYLQGVYEINKKLPGSRKISIYGLDAGVDWSNPTIEDLKGRDALIPVRDSIMGNLFLQYFEKQNTKKALVVLNYRHAFLMDLFGRTNAGRFIADTHKNKAANVLINSFILTKNPDYPDNVALAHDGKWDASFLKAGKNNLGFDLQNSPFGDDSFDMVPFPNEFQYKDIFTGFIYFQYFMDIRTVSGIENYIDGNFAAELLKRYQLEQQLYNNELPDIEKLKENYNTVTEETYRQQFPYLEKDIGKWLK